jgi:dolichyl-phosphate beta-glucosyltransferase
MSDPVLSVIIPAFNEAGRVKQTLDKVDRFLSSTKRTYEIVVVDDGSTDDTVSAVREAQAHIRHLKLVQLSANQGKGRAVKAGMLYAKGRARLFMDADNSTSIEQVEKLIPYLQNGYDVVIGSRRCPGALVDVQQNPVREFLGSVFRAIANLLVPLPYYDTQNGFKLFSSGAAQALFTELQTKGWSFDVEVLARAGWQGLKVKEVPIVWINDDRSHLSLTGMIRMLVDLARISRMGWQPLTETDSAEVPVS